MRKSRVLLAGVAVAAAGAATSAFTAGNTNNAPGDKVAGFGEVVVSGVTVTNVAYTPLASDASKLDNVIFTIDEDPADLLSMLTVSTGTPIASGAIVCTNTPAGGLFKVTCDVPNSVNIQDVTKVGLTVTSK
jgi:hypothetical protein